MGRYGGGGGSTQVFTQDLCDDMERCDDIDAILFVRAKEQRAQWKKYAWLVGMAGDDDGLLLSVILYNCV